MKRRKWVILTVLVLVFGIAIGTTAAGLISKIKAELRQDFVVVVDGEVKEFKNVDGDRVYPILYEGTTYLPLRAIGELMGKKVYWYENDKRIELKEEKSTVTDADVIVGADNKSNDIADKKPDKDEKPKVDKNNFIGEAKAKEIALDKAGFKENQVKALKVKLDKDDGVWQYEVEFKQGYDEYEVDINAETGNIIFYEKDAD